MEGCHGKTHGVSPHKAELANCSILLVENRSEDYRIISHILENAGARVSVAAGGTIAIDMTRDADDAGTPYDLILMDVGLSGQNCHEASRRLRGDGHNMPIIALTAHVMAGDREKRLQAGFTDYILKPVNHALLIEKIRSALNSAGSRD